jgi:hypothetical protein
VRASHRAWYVEAPDGLCFGHTVKRGRITVSACARSAFEARSAAVVAMIAAEGRVEAHEEAMKWLRVRLSEQRLERQLALAPMTGAHAQETD